MHTSVFFKEASATQALESKKSPANTASCITEKRKGGLNKRQKEVLRLNLPMQHQCHDFCSFGDNNEDEKSKT